MTDELAPLSAILDFTEGELDLLRSALLALLGRGCILRGLPREEELYNFATNNSRTLEAWFACMGASLRRDEASGVIAFSGGRETRSRLGRDETCALLVLRLLYDERLGELRLSSFPSVSVFDFTTKFRAITDAELKKTRLVEILRRMAAFKLVELSGEPSDPDSLLILYPSLALALDRGAIDELLLAVRARGGGVAPAALEEAEGAEEQVLEEAEERTAEEAGEDGE